MNTRTGTAPSVSRISNRTWKPPARGRADQASVVEGHNKVSATTIKAVLDRIEMNLRREVVIGEAEIVATALWIAHTPIYSGFKLTPRLFVTSVNPGSGKSTLLKLVSEISNGGKWLNKTTEAYLGRLKDYEGPDITVVLDQLDNAFDFKSTSTGPLIDRLIAGADHGAKQGLVAQVGDQLKPVELDLFYPMALGKIGSLPNPALNSRCIVIHMHPASPAEAQQLTTESIGQADKDLRRQLRTILADRGAELAKAKPAIPASLVNRGADKWRPLLAIADAAGDQWPARARDAALALESEHQLGRSPTIELLCNILTATKEWPHKEIFSEELEVPSRGW